MAGITSKLLSLLTKSKANYGPFPSCQQILSFLMRMYLWTCFPQPYRKKMVQHSCGKKADERVSTCKSPFLQVKCLRVWSLLVVCWLGTISAEFLPLLLVLLPSLGSALSCNNPISRLPMGTPGRIVLGSLVLLSLERKIISGFSHRFQELCLLSHSCSAEVWYNSVFCFIISSLHKGFLS